MNDELCRIARVSIGESESAVAEWLFQWSWWALLFCSLYRRRCRFRCGSWIRCRTSRHGATWSTRPLLHISWHRLFPRSMFSWAVVLATVVVLIVLFFITCRGLCITNSIIWSNASLGIPPIKFISWTLASKLIQSSHSRSFVKTAYMVGENVTRHSKILTQINRKLKVSSSPFAAFCTFSMFPMDIVMEIIAFRHTGSTSSIDSIRVWIIPFLNWNIEAWTAVNCGTFIHGVRELPMHSGAMTLAVRNVEERLLRECDHTAVSTIRTARNRRLNKEIDSHTLLYHILTDAGTNGQRGALANKHRHYLRHMWQSRYPGWHDYIMYWDQCMGLNLVAMMDNIVKPSCGWCEGGLELLKPQLAAW